MHQDVYVRIFIILVFKVMKNWKLPKCVAKGDYQMKYGIHSTKYYLGIMAIT